MCVHPQFATGCILQIRLSVYEEIIFVAKSIGRIIDASIFVSFMLIPSVTKHYAVAAVGRLISGVNVVIRCSYLAISLSLSLYLLVN